MKDISRVALEENMLKIESWPYRLTVRTEPSQGLNRGSIPRRVTATENKPTAGLFSCAVKTEA